MTTAEVYQLLRTTGLPVAYYSYPVGEAPALPYILYYYPQSRDMYADSKNYVKINALNIELYTKNKDFATEKLVEDALNGVGLSYSRTESFLSSENMYEVLFETEVIING